MAGDNKFTINDIKGLKVRKYNALKEFMGWGVRYNDNDRCFTVSGDNALEIELKNEEKILIGTQKAAELSAVMASFFDHLNQ